MKLYVTGIAGTGKTSIAHALADRGVQTIDTDELSHWENKETKQRADWDHEDTDEWHRSYVWVCNVEALKEFLALSKDVVVVGHSSNQDDYLGLFDKVYVLRCSPDTIIARIASRTDNEFGKRPGELKRILDWQERFESEMVEKGATPLDADRPLAEVIDDIVSNG